MADAPPSVKARIDRGRRKMMRDAPKRRLCMRFERGDTYWYLNDKGMLSVLPTVTSANGGGKPPHRIRNTYNFIRPIIEDKVSAATQRVPGYDIGPTSTDPEDWAAAKLSEKVAFFGYDQWRLRSKTIKAVKTAIGGGGAAYALPYFDPNVGPYRMVDGQWVGEGDVKVRILNGNQVMWEPGVDFEDSPWWATHQALPVEEVRELPGFDGLPLTPDAVTSDVPTDQTDRDNLVMVTDYFERPCPQYPEGRRIVLANNRMIVDFRQVNPAGDPWEPYPLRDTDGSVIDEPILLRLKYTYDPDDDDDFGLTWQLIDAQRTIQDCWNKLLEWKNRCLNPQMLAPKGSLITPPDDVPGAVRYYRPIGGQVPQWEQPPVVPQSLFQMLDQMKQDMKEMAAYEDIHADANVASSTVQQVIAKSQARWQSFLGDLADWHARLMHRCLLLVARHYTEPRLLLIRGRFGTEPIGDFRGAKLGSQVNVTVLPGSLEYRTRQQITQQVLAYADRGWVTPQQAMAAIDGGKAENLIQSYELDVARANRIIARIRDGSVMDMPNRMQTDPTTQQVVEVPAWMPSEVDNVSVWKTVIGSWMKTDEFEALPPNLQEVAKLIWGGLQTQQTAQAFQQMQVQNAQAASLGLQNASKPQSPAPPPDQPQLGPGT